MAGSVFDSPLYAKLFPTGDMGRLFSDSAAIRAMLLVEGALAKVQGDMGVIPKLSAEAIHRASMEVQIDPSALAESTGENGVCVPGLVAAFGAAMQAPEHAEYIHWGATSQDIIDTGLMLRLRQAMTLLETDTAKLLQSMAHMADVHAETPLAARTYGQLATPTTWGAIVAQWGNPLLDALEALPATRDSSLWVSLSGAAGTAAALGGDAPALRAALAQALDLKDPGRSWHTDRGPILHLAGWMSRLSASLGAMGASLVGHASSGISEIRFETAGASSTMPQKQNPVDASAIQALAEHIAGLQSTLNRAAQHQYQRDGAAWFTEWIALPQLVLGTAAALQLANRLMTGLEINEAAMHSALEDGHGLAFAEMLSFALTQEMSRSKAKKTVTSLCARAVSENRSLQDLAVSEYPWLDRDLFQITRQLGQAPAEAKRFAARVKAL